jgi:hypothetical protein
VCELNKKRTDLVPDQEPPLAIAACDNEVLRYGTLSVEKIVLLMVISPVSTEVATS